jgi:hypothetical protein
MSDEIDREVTSKKVTSLPNNSVNGRRVSEQRTTRVTNDSSLTGVVIIVLLGLAVGAGAIAYFVNYRPVPAPAPILIPSANEPIKENKSTIIERNNTTIKEVSPAAPQPTPKVEINLPVITQPPAAEPVPAPRVTVTAQPQVVTPTATPSASPSTSPAN